MDTSKQLYVKTRDEWRAWLEKNHDAEPEIWLVFYKKGSGKPSLSLGDAQEEALCFGWIDSKLQRIDDEHYILHFTPRRKGSVWSDTNKARVAKLIKNGQMTAAGLAVIPYAHPERAPKQVRVRREEEDIPPDVAKAIQANKKAAEWFETLPPSQRRIFIRYMCDAKRPETREKHLKQAVEWLAARKKFGINGPE